ncbi:hypothetical protein JCM33374_g4844 [Metschnikowia sp. JCM 33374]|nr:hypothetical protein JCM33374_g4844 [Metschnikowia sp. JCM 33374]
MVSGIYICHWPDRDLEYSRCEVLLHRSYHNDVPSVPSIIASYTRAYTRQKPEERGPFTCYQGVSYISLWAENDIVLLAVARRNVNAMSTISLLSQLQSLISHYFSEHTIQTAAARNAAQVDADPSCFSRDLVVDNHALVFELLDECVDFGLAQVTDFNILKEYIKMEVNLGKTHLDKKADGDSSDSDSDRPSRSRSLSLKALKKDARNKKKIHIKSTHNQAVRTDVLNDAAANYINSSIVRTQVSAISWRPKGIFYPKNEIYVDIIEDCEFLYDLETDSVRTNQINGVCVVRSYLSGMPVCKLGLNEKYISQVEFDEALDIEEEYGEAPETIPGNQLNHADDDIPETAEDPENAEESQSLCASGETSAAPKLMKVPITNVQFHSCVELSKVYKENLIFFTPPDDEFRLFSYSVEQQRRKRTKPLLMVSPVYRVLAKQNKLQIMCTLHTNFRKKLHCNKVIVKLPVSPALFPLDNSNSDNFRFKCEMGEVRFSVDSSEILWAIGDLPGSRKSVKLMAEVSLSSCNHLSEGFISAALLAKPHLGNADETYTKPGSTNAKEGVLKGEDGAPGDATDDSTISQLDKYYGVGNASSSVFTRLQQSATNVTNDVSISFEMPMFTYSGLKVTYLRVDEDTMKYTCFPWVRYATRTSSSKNGTAKIDPGSKAAGAKFRFKMGPSNFTVIDGN